MTKNNKNEGIDEHNEKKFVKIRRDFLLFDV